MCESLGFPWSFNFRIVCSDPHHPPPAILSIQVQDFLPPGLVPTATSAHESLLLSIAILSLSISPKLRGSVLPMTSLL